MIATFLDRILQAKRSRLTMIAREADTAAMRRFAQHVRSGSTAFRFSESISRASSPNIIAEIKRVSPSRGPICMDADVAAISREYAAGGAAAISVLTEEDFFAGSLEDLQLVRTAVNIPILRKDFIIDKYQIYESAASGADAILLIVAALKEENLSSFLEIARDELRMDAIVEVHDAAELATAFKAGATLIGVNNRNLKTFDVSLEVSTDLIRFKKDGTLFISESGISEPGQVAKLAQLGFDGFLIGESLMRESLGRQDALMSLMGRETGL